MKRVLKITATDGRTIAKVRIEVSCSKSAANESGWGPRHLAHLTLHDIASGVMEAMDEADYFTVPLSQQRVGR